MLIDSVGNKLGLIDIKEALKIASDQSLDLVQVSPSDASPVVCKLLDFGKHLFDKKKIYQHLELKQKNKALKKLNLDRLLILVIIKLN